MQSFLKISLTQAIRDPWQSHVSSRRTAWGPLAESLHAATPRDPVNDKLARRDASQEGHVLLVRRAPDDRRRVHPGERMNDTSRHPPRRVVDAFIARRDQCSLSPYARKQGDNTAQRRVKAGGATRVLDDGLANLPPYPTVAALLG
jgi:hypothetical protein